MKNFLGGLIAGLFLFGSAAHAETIESWLTAEEFALANLTMATGIRTALEISLHANGKTDAARCIDQKTPEYLVARTRQLYREMPLPRRAELGIKAEYKEEYGELVTDVSYLMAVAAMTTCTTSEQMPK